MRSVKTVPCRTQEWDFWISLFCGAVPSRINGSLTYIGLYNSKASLVRIALNGSLYTSAKSRPSQSFHNLRKFP